MGLDIYAYMALLTSHTLAGKMGTDQSDSDAALDWDGDNQALFCMVCCNVVVESASYVHMGH